MKRGSYLKCFKLGCIFIKYVSPMNLVEKYILTKLNTKKIINYSNEIRELGIKTARIYFIFRVVNKMLIFQEYICGPTINYYLSKTDTIEEGITVFNQLITVFNVSLRNPDLKIDWNLKNFIINDGIVLVDFTPPLYSNQIEDLNHPSLIPLRELYLNPKIQLQGIVGYWLKSYFKLDDNDFFELYANLITITLNITGINIKVNKEETHVFAQRLLLIEKCLNAQLSYEEMKVKFCEISLKKEIDKYQGGKK